MKKVLLLAVWLCYVLQTNAQSLHASGSGMVSGKILDQKNTPVEFATVMLLSAKDSSLIKGDITDSSGAYEFDQVPFDSYIVSVSSVDAEKYFSKAITISAENTHVNVPEIILPESAKTLQGVTVEATKPLIQHTSDKTVMNVENSSLGSSGNALDVLQRAPGVTVDNDSKVRLKGKTEVLIMIDGKETHLTPDQITTQLRNMSSDMISQVEIITNPGAKYSAEGNAGIINIITKKNKKLGTNGSLTGGLSKGEKWGYNGGLNLNYRDKKLNLYGSYNRSDNGEVQKLQVQRNIMYNDVLSIVHENSDMNREYHDNEFKAGIDYYLDDKNTFGFMATGFLFHETDNNYTSANITNGQNEFQSSSITNGVADGKYNNVSFDLTYDGKLDTSGRALSVDANYAYYTQQNENNYTTIFYDATGNETGTPLNEYDHNPTTVDIKSLKADYTHPLHNNMKLEAGIKVSYVTTDNNLLVYTLQQDAWITDSYRSNHFKYTENVNAAYINFSKKKNLSAGLRGEQTVAEGTSITINNNFKRNYFQLFPSVSVNDQINDNNALSLSYSRRIDRPQYQQLNPFIYYLDQYLYEVGNPNLNPQLTHSLSLSYTYKQSYSITFDYALTNHNIIELFYQIDSSKITYLRPDNFDQVNFFDVVLYTPVQVTKWWNFTPTITAYYIYQNTNYLGSNFGSKKLSCNINIQNSLKFPKGFSADVVANYQSGGIWSIATFQPYWFASAGIQKSFKDGKARLKFNVSDIFFTNHIKGAIQYSNIDAKFFQQNDSRQASLTFTYNFGNQSAQQRQHHSGSEEEMNRVKKGNAE